MPVILSVTDKRNKIRLGRARVAWFNFAEGLLHEVGCRGPGPGVAAALVACGAEPLTVEQCVLSEADVPGSLPDPVETRQTASTLDEFTAWHDIRAAEVDPRKLEEAGFVSAIHDTRFLPETPGGQPGSEREVPRRRGAEGTVRRVHAHHQIGIVTARTAVTLSERHVHDSVDEISKEIAEVARA